MELSELNAHELHSLLAKGEVGTEEVTRDFINYIKKVDKNIRAFTAVSEEIALQQARENDKLLADKDRDSSQLAGIPMGLKDNICVRDIPTTCSSKILRNYEPPFDAHVYERLHEAQSVLLGKMNMDEFAMGSSTENSRFFDTKNPWNREYVPGGSSGGAAAAVAAGEIVYALGSDTGGSIRQPAAFCGVVGLKPTYGRVSRYGIVPFASSLDQVGPITKDVKDCALVLNRIAGHDHRDSTSVNMQVPDFEKALTGSIKGIKIGIPEEYFGEGIDPVVEEKIKDSIKVLEGLGAICEYTSLPHTEYALPAYYLLATAEASSNLARFDGVRHGYRNNETRDTISMYKMSRCEGFGAEVKRRIMLGTYALSAGYYDAYYLKALKVRTLVKQDFERAFEKFDILITPTTPTTAFKIGEKVADPLALYKSDLLTSPVNLAGVPAVSLPCGLKEGLPIGLQIIARPFAEDMLLNAAYAYESHRQEEFVLPKLEVL